MNTVLFKKKKGLIGHLLTFFKLFLKNILKHNIGRFLLGLRISC